MTETLLTLEVFKELKLEEGIDKDYGKIPNVKKPCLLLPGAQKIAKYYGYTHAFDIQEAVENHEDKFYFYRVRTLIASEGAIIGDMVGSCSSHDSGKQSAPPNSILKMAEKRAYVSAILYVVAGSGLFSADVEDMSQKELTGSEDGVKWFPRKAGAKNWFCGACGNLHITERMMVGKPDDKWVAKECYERLKTVEGASTPEEIDQDEAFKSVLEQMDLEQLKEQGYTLADEKHIRTDLDQKSKDEIINFILENR